MSKEEYTALEKVERTGVLEYYTRNRERVSGELKEEGLLRGDYLRSRTKFGGLWPASAEVLQIRGDVESDSGLFELVLNPSGDGPTE